MATPPGRGHGVEGAGGSGSRHGPRHPRIAPGSPESQTSDQILFLAQQDVAWKEDTGSLTTKGLSK